MKYFLIAGEASGDLHASNLMEQIKHLDQEAEFQFLGGDLMEKFGTKALIHYRKMAFMGFINVLKNIGTIKKNLALTKQAIAEFNPDVVILIDYPSFNLRIAEFVKKNLPNIIVDYYISPKLWAWKSYRIKSIKKYIDTMYTIFPFETEYYQQFNYQVEYVGNPTVDSVAAFETQNPLPTDFLERNALKNRPIIALLAGSRKQEISACLPKMASMVSKFPNYQFVIAGAPGIEPNFYKDVCDESLPLIFNQTYELVRHSKAAIVNSGTATLETALLRTPEVVVYHVFGGRFANWLQKVLIKTKYISLVNIIANQELVKELVAADFTTHNLHMELDKLLHDTEHLKTIHQGYENIIKRLGEPGTAVKAAQKIRNQFHKKS